MIKSTMYSEIFRQTTKDLIETKEKSYTFCTHITQSSHFHQWISFLQQARKLPIAFSVTIEDLMEHGSCH